MKRNSQVTKLESIAQVAHLLTRGAAIIDAGAFISDFTGEMSKIFPDSPIHVFEPTPSSMEKLRVRFGNQKLISLNQLALAQKAGMIDFYINGSDITNSTFPRPKDGTKRYYGAKAVEKELIRVQSVKFDEYARANNIDRISILKMDLQGGELNALEGMKSTLEAQKVDLVVLEAMFIAHYHQQPLLKAVWDRMETYGYSLYDLCELSWMQSDGQIRQGDAIFLSPDLGSRL